MIILDDYPYIAFSGDAPYGGLVTKTSHIFHSLGLQRKKFVYSNANKIENRLREYGYGIKKRNIPFEFLQYFKGDILIAEMHRDLINSESEQFLSKFDNITLSLTNTKFRLPDSLLEKIREKWKFIAIRKTIANFYKKTYNIEPEVIPHLWYKYPLPKFTGEKKGAIACCRLDHHKHIDIIFGANDMLPEKHPNIVKVYGSKVSGIYNFHTLGLERLSKYWMGSFAKNWQRVAMIQQPAKFGINLTDFPEDGGGTENTTLEYIYHDVAVILNRNWIKKGFEFAGESEFIENENCFAVESKKELADLLQKNPDTTDIVKNARKILDNHSNQNLINQWSKYVRL